MFGNKTTDVERTVVLADIHYPKHDPKALAVAEKIIAEVKPHRIIYLGDALDMTPISHWLKGKIKTLEGLRLKKDYDGFNQVLDRHMTLAKGTLKEVVYIEGNHETWVTDAIDEDPSKEGFFDLALNLKFKERGIKFVRLNDTFKLGKLYLTHGYYTNQHHAAKTVGETEKSTMYGHAHTNQQHTKVTMINSDAHMGICIPCLCRMNPDYAANKPNNWIQGIGIVYTTKDGNFNHYTVNIIKGTAIWNGKVFKA